MKDPSSMGIDCREVQTVLRRWYPHDLPFDLGKDSKNNPLTSNDLLLNSQSH
jgi:hypothetical protein